MYKQIETDIVDIFSLGKDVFMCGVSNTFQYRKLEGPFVVVKLHNYVLVSFSINYSFEIVCYEHVTGILIVKTLVIVV